MSPAIAHYVALKRRLRRRVDERLELGAEIAEAEAVLEDIENNFSESEYLEWKALGLPKGLAQ